MKRILKWIARRLTTKHRYEQRLLELGHFLVALEEEMVRKNRCSVELSWSTVHDQFEKIARELE